MFYSVCGVKFSEQPVCVNVFLNKISANSVAPFLIFHMCERAAQIPDGFASFLGIARRRMTPNSPAFPECDRGRGRLAPCMFNVATKPQFLATRGCRNVAGG